MIPWNYHLCFLFLLCRTFVQIWRASARTFWILFTRCRSWWSVQEALGSRPISNRMSRRNSRHGQVGRSMPCNNWHCGAREIWGPARAFQVLLEIHLWRICWAFARNSSGASHHWIKVDGLMTFGGWHKNGPTITNTICFGSWWMPSSSLLPPRMSGQHTCCACLASRELGMMCGPECLVRGDSRW